LLTAYLQQSLTGREDLETGTGRQQVSNEWRSCEEALEIVEHKQDVLGT
jgi:hypothetical protein